MKQLNEKVAIVTGAGQGIGKGIAMCLAKRGVKVVCTGRREAPIQQTVAEIEEAGGQGLPRTTSRPWWRSWPAPTPATTPASP